MLFFMNKKDYKHVIEYVKNNNGKDLNLKITENNNIAIKAQATYIFYIKISD